MSNNLIFQDRYNAGLNSTFVGAGGGTAFQANPADTDDSYWYIYHAWRYDQVTNLIKVLRS